MTKNDKAARLESLEKARHQFGLLVQAFERDFGLNSYLNRAPTIQRPEQVKGAELLTDRSQLLKQLPVNSSVIEVGVDRGAFSRAILNTTKPNSLFLIDIDLGRMDENNRQILAESGVVEFIESDSGEALARMIGQFDWIYIDAHHGYDYVKRDIREAAPKIRIGGYLVFNDYTLWSPANMMNYGVSRAVNEFLNDNFNWNVAYFALQGGGYHDIALRRNE